MVLKSICERGGRRVNQKYKCFFLPIYLCFICEAVLPMSHKIQNKYHQICINDDTMYLCVKIYILVIWVAKNTKEYH